jgi:acyl-CoA synthetase (AMP-forming)/AMP-acid ligase II
MRVPKSDVAYNKFSVASNFSLQDSNGNLFTYQSLLRDMQIAAAAIEGCTNLTIDARETRSVILGLMLCQTYRLNVGLARDISSEYLPLESQNEIAPNLFAWLDHKSEKMPPGIRISTSGTTGKFKTAVHDLNRLMAAVKQRTPTYKTSWLLTYEPASFAGIQVIIIAALHGALLHSPKRSISALAYAVCEGITHVSGTPSFWRALLAALPANCDLPLKVATLGGESSPQDLLDAIACRFPGVVIRHIYASTEAGVGFTVSDGLAGFPSSWLQDGVQGVQLRIRDNELQILTTRSMLGYAGGAINPFDADWLRTGDLVEMRNDRVLFLGRSDNVVNIGGTKVLPEQVENMLCCVEGVTDIVIFAHPNPILGFILIAQVCAAPGTDLYKLEAALKSQAIAKLPALARPVRYRFVENMALLNGKKARTNVSD